MSNVSSAEPYDNEREVAASGLVAPPDEDRHSQLLDLRHPMSPVEAQWLTGTSVTLPFPDESFDCVLIDENLFVSLNSGSVLLELERALRDGGEIRVVLPAFAGDSGDDSAALLESALAKLAPIFPVRSVDSDDCRTVILASKQAPLADGGGAAAIAAALAQSVRRTRILDQQVGKLRQEVTQTRESAARESARLREQEARLQEQRLLFTGQTSRIEELSASVADLRMTKQKLEHEHSQAISSAKLAGGEVEKLRRDLKRERLRVETLRARKWSRIGDQVKLLRRPWRAPTVLYRIARIATGPTVLPSAPSSAGSHSPAQGTQGRVTGPSGGSSQGHLSDTIPRYAIPERDPQRTLRVATIMDEFSELAFRYEFTVIPVPREGWQALLESERPDLLLVESAWNGNGGQWKFTLAGGNAPKEAVLELVAYCRSAGIPTVFWNKEDPLEFDTFLESARQFDWVFTVDQNCVDRYRAELGHSRIGVLPFGVQPRIHNPTAAFTARTEDVAFAGTYYSGKYPERQEQIKNLLNPCTDLGLHIFSRWESNPRYAFPEELKDSVVGSLDYAQTLSAYRRYKVFLNVNSVTDSETMFSRRVLELLACGTPVVSGPSPGMTAMLGEGVVNESNDTQSTRLKVRSLLRSQELRDRQAVQGIRAVMEGNTYGHRVDHLLNTIGLSAGTAPSRRVSVVAPTNRAGTIEQILQNVSCQKHEDVELILVLHGLDQDEEQILGRAAAYGLKPESVTVLRAAQEWPLGRVLNEGVSLATGSYVAKMDDDDLYGPHYLSDQLLAFEYTDADIVGKWSRHIFLESVPCMGIIFPGHEHRYTELVGGGTILAKRNVFEAVSFPDRDRGEDTHFLRECAAQGFRTYSTDRFNFVYMRHADLSRHTYKLPDLEHLSNTRVVAFDRALEHVFV